MKSYLNKILTIFMAILLIFTLPACGKVQVNEVTGSYYIEVLSIEELKKEFENKGIGAYIPKFIPERYLFERAEVIYSDRFGSKINAIDMYFKGEGVNELRFTILENDYIDTFEENARKLDPSYGANSLNGTEDRIERDMFIYKGEDYRVYGIAGRADRRKLDAIVLFNEAAIYFRAYSPSGEEEQVYTELTDMARSMW